MKEAKFSKEFDGFAGYVSASMSYTEYLDLVEQLADADKTTGAEQTEDRIYFTRLNRQRMRRLGKTVKLEPATAKAAKALNRPLFWLVLTESWCGDAAQNIPAIEKIAAENSLITTHYLLRDENLELMDRYLTDGGRAIPKLICVDAETLLELGDWGSRPKAAQDYFLEMREQGMEKSELMEALQRWYLKDREKSIQSEFAELLKSWA